MKSIGFNKPYLTGKEYEYIADAVQSAKISGNGKYTKRCQDYFSKRYGFKQCLLTTSCTDAMEMAAILLNIQSGDEVIAPSFTFVSTINAFIMRGAKIVFADSQLHHPNIDAEVIQSLVNERTKALIVVHYAGVSCDMDRIMGIAKRNHLFVVEDAAQSIDSYYIGSDNTKRPLGSIGNLGTFSFHETKNIISGEGGMLVINDDQFKKRSEIIWEKGTDRAAFFRGEIDKYGWVDIGSSFLPSDIIAAFLWAQLEHLDDIQNKRKYLWNEYEKKLKVLEMAGKVELPKIPVYACNNAHMFYIVCKNLDQRSKLISFLKDRNINAVFHYQSLHRSKYFSPLHDGRILPNADRYTDCLLRLPFYYELEIDDIDDICNAIKEFYVEG